MAVAYPSKFKAEMIQRMLGKNPQSPSALAEKTGIHASTLRLWRRRAISETTTMKKKSKHRQNRNKKTHNPGRPRRHTLEEKLKLLLEAASKRDEELGTFLRFNGLHESDLERFREDVEAALGTIKQTDRERAKEQKNTRMLEKELRRKEKALAEAAALLVLKKKVQEIWGDEDDDIPERNGK